MDYDTAEQQRFMKLEIFDKLVELMNQCIESDYHQMEGEYE
jgi:hypothetical protein